MKESSRMNVAAAFEGMAQSSFFLLVGKDDTVQEIRDKGDCYQQLRMARVFKKPVLLMLDRQLRPLEQAEIRNCLDGMEIIGTISFDSVKMNARARDQFLYLLACWRKKTGQAAIYGRNYDGQQ